MSLDSNMGLDFITLPFKHGEGFFLQNGANELKDHVMVSGTFAHEHLQSEGIADALTAFKGEVLDSKNAPGRQ